MDWNSSQAKEPDQSGTMKEWLGRKLISKTCFVYSGWVGTLGLGGTSKLFEMQNFKHKGRFSRDLSNPNWSDLGKKYLKIKKWEMCQKRNFINVENHFYIWFQKDVKCGLFPGKQDCKWIFCYTILSFQVNKFDTILHALHFCYWLGFNSQVLHESQTSNLVFC